MNYSALQCVVVCCNTSAWDAPIGVVKKRCVAVNV